MISGLPRIDKVATGSTAEIRDPKSKASIIVKLSTNPATDEMYTKNPMRNAEITVPGKANNEIVQKFRKNSFSSKPYPASNIIGGKRRKKNISGSKVRNFNSSSEG